MNSNLKYFQNMFNSHQIKMKNEFLDKISQKFTIFYVTQLEDIKTINNTKNETNFIFIDTMECNQEEFLIIFFEQKIILISKTNISLLESFFTNNSNSKIIVISNEIEEIISKYVHIDKQESKEMTEVFDSINYNEISRFFNSFIVKISSNKQINYIWHELQRSILSCIVQKSYLKMNKNRLLNFDFKDKPENREIELNNSNNIKITNLGASISSTELICHIGLEQLFAMKIFYNSQRDKLFGREKRNYEMIHHPLIPKFYGIGKKNKEELLLVEYIKGSSLDKISEMKLNKEEKKSIQC